MERILALVEGHTEMHFINSTYPNAIVQRPFPNGDDVSINLIIDSIVDALETVSSVIVKVLVLLDREKRSEEAKDILSSIREGVSLKCGNRTLYIGVADRQIENWIMADEYTIKEIFCDPLYSYKGDGSKGKSDLERVSQNVIRGPRDKALLLKRCSAVRASQKSDSLRTLVQQIDFDWTWVAT